MHWWCIGLYALWNLDQLHKYTTNLLNIYISGSFCPFFPIMPIPGQRCSAPGALDCHYPNDSCCCGLCDDDFSCDADPFTGEVVWQKLSKNVYAFWRKNLFCYTSHKFPGCGISQARRKIHNQAAFGGHNVYPHEHPWQVNALSALTGTQCFWNISGVHWNQVHNNHCAAEVWRLSHLKKHNNISGSLLPKMGGRGHLIDAWVRWGDSWRS